MTQSGKREQGAAAQGAGKQFGQIAGLVATVDGAEYQLNRPLCSDALGLEGIGQAEAAHHKIRPLGADPLQLAFHVLPLADAGAGWQKGQLGIEQLAVEVGRAHLDQLHAALAVQEAPQRKLQLGIGQQKEPFASQ